MPKKQVNEKMREEILKATIAKIKKDSPDDVVGVYQDIGEDIDVEVISTGSLAVDAAIGGGFAKGRLVNIVGHPSSGKTTLALTTCANLQKEDPNAVIYYVDAEAALDTDYARALGVDIDKVIIHQPSSGNDGYRAIETMIGSGICDLVVVDSIAAMLPKEMLYRDYDDPAQPGTFAKLTTAACGKINLAATKKGTTVIFINHWKPKVVMNQYQPTGGMGGSFDQPGGNQLAFYMTQILEVAKTGTITENGEIISNVTRMVSKKNKIAPPNKKAEFVITYGKGLDKSQEAIGLGIALGIIIQRGAFYSIPGYEEMQGSIQGRSKFGKFLEDNPAIFEKLTNDIKGKISGAREINISKDENANVNIPHDDELVDEN